MASIAEECGRYRDAERFLATADDLASADDIQHHARAGGLRGRILARQGCHDEALVAVEASEALLEASESPGVLAGVLLDRAEVLRLAGRPDEPERALRGALRLFERKQNLPAVRRASALLGSGAYGLAAGSPAPP
jgi:tetratricopeptide (TPR) repeat protein